MPTPFADLETRLGQTAAAMLADATLTGSGGLSVDGIFDESRATELDMRARRLQFIGPSGTLADSLAEEAAVTVTKLAVATNYKVAMPAVVAGGQVVIDLKRAA
jgi:peptidoglycan hydrolase-like protein with peptidoglycan-binding domain